MSACVYTISHPFTNEIVYVGCTSDIESRKRQYLRKGKNKRPIDNWISDLMSSYILPKIDIISECDKNEMFEEEMFWIRMLRSWGFNLLNVKKLNPPVKPCYSNSKMTYLGGPVKTKNSKSWSLDDFKLGNKFYLGTTYAHRNSFYTTFRGYCKKFNLIRFLHFEKTEENIIATVVDVKPSYKKVRIKKGYPKAEDRVTYNTDFKPVEVIGGSAIFYNITKATLAAKVSYHTRHIKNKRFNYHFMADGGIKIIRIY